MPCPTSSTAPAAVSRAARLLAQTALTMRCETGHDSYSARGTQPNTTAPLSTRIARRPSSALPAPAPAPLPLPLPPPLLLAPAACDLASSRSSYCDVSCTAGAAADSVDLVLRKCCAPPAAEAAE